ncbi:GntR family transcriptional regulator [Amorphus orientalis]|uniref:DNA-binding GntR family transcriptional regulator n=1 Tax=Amorphus orientalis TaxID=649198 RepID=A0AAE4AR65_9HYPH|nr:GntR family transcriptional regulator [Amorphus orientalis]MDQ0313857.1 DNA-binding GntR family transcriptional regulator [Amorphus orientalis]
MSASAFAELKRAPALADQIYDGVLQSLRAGNYAPGERIVESALAQELSVSRSPVREALSRLTADGLLESQGTGFRVAAPTAADMAEIFDMRRLLEPVAARRVARDADTGLMRALADRLSRTQAAHEVGDFPEFLDANYDFRAVWVARVPNRRLGAAILKFDDQAGFVRRKTLVRPEAQQEVLELLGRCVEAFRTNDEDAAAAAAEGIIDGAERHYRAAADATD